jgi:DNA-binding transcriptional LysR family regulator
MTAGEKRRPDIDRQTVSEPYLRRIHCEYRDYLADHLRALGLVVRIGFQSEREDWIQMMVAAGLGVRFLPEFSPTVPGVRIQPVTAPEVVREVSLVSEMASAGSGHVEFHPRSVVVQCLPFRTSHNGASASRFRHRHRGTEPVQARLRPAPPRCDP